MRIGFGMCASLAIAATAQLAAANNTTVVTFDNGTEGWIGPQGFGGSTVIDAAGGNGGANLHTDFQDFGIEFRNSTNTAFVQDLTQYSSVTFSVDVKVNLMEFFGLPVSRPWVLELRDYDQPGPDNPLYSSVWFELANISLNPNWVTYSITIDNPQSAALPAGWGGSGDIDGSFNPILPAGVTFASILAGYDEIAFTTFEPGFFFGESEHDVQLDNITIITKNVPAPGALALLGIAGVLGRRRRR